MICATYGERDKGRHLPASHYGEEIEWFVLIRDPIERLVSALNHVNSGDPLERTMQQALRAGGQQVFWPQAHWIDREAAFWPFERMADAFSAAGISGELKHENKSVKRFTAEDVEPWRDEIQAFYAHDFVLRDAALKEPGAVHDPQGKMVRAGRQAGLSQGDGPKPRPRQRKSTARQRKPRTNK